MVCGAGYRYCGPLMTRSTALALLALGLLATPALAADDPAEQSPFGGQLPPRLVKPDSQTVPPPGFELSAAEAIEIAAARPRWSARSSAESPATEPVASTRGDALAGRATTTTGDEVAQVIVDDGDGR